ncbi:uncharacterized protein BDCG_05370 [Blastomyces dermatitidis ER-3]|uniref:BTB domain-containing protein n=1 Tax=Ajellomyces dermatitidis (strain ER-3 / ATCC MYA-2586) TaxID=559297 RepID=A0ABP2F1C8_AJEDR|nr:uncharacterized protein BDCG_05370 [Blastomyces dermatitidis ER-3]EEQ90250.1 hypothetical protein BDCG_05370 [Blastomyces dermatitidis ER-3]
MPLCAYPLILQQQLLLTDAIQPSTSCRRDHVELAWWRSYLRDVLCLKHPARTAKARRQVRVIALYLSSPHELFRLCTSSTGSVEATSSEALALRDTAFLSCGDRMQRSSLFRSHVIPQQSEFFKNILGHKV